MRDYVMLGLFVIVVAALVIPKLLFLVIPIVIITVYQANRLDRAEEARRIKPINVNR